MPKKPNVEGGLPHLDTGSRLNYRDWAFRWHTAAGGAGEHPSLVAKHPRPLRLPQKVRAEQDGLCVVSATCNSALRRLPLGRIRSGSASYTSSTDSRTEDGNSPISLQNHSEPGPRCSVVPAILPTASPRSLVYVRLLTPCCVASLPVAVLLLKHASLTTPPSPQSHDGPVECNTPAHADFPDVL